MLQILWTTSKSIYCQQFLLGRQFQQRPMFNQQEEIRYNQYSPLLATQGSILLVDRDKLAHHKQEVVSQLALSREIKALQFLE